MNTYWLHRIGYKTEVSYPLLFSKEHENFLSIGWRDIAEKFPNIRDGGLDYKECMKECYGYSGKSITSLKNFIKFKKDDLIVVPTRDKDFVICKVLDDKTYIPSEMERNIISVHNLDNPKLDLGFFKKVKFEANIPRYGFADNALTSRMKMRQTNGDISDIKGSVDKAIERFNAKTPISLYRDLSTEFTQVSLKKILDDLNPNSFEKLIESYFKSMGANVERNPEKNSENKSGDVDIIATFEELKLIICVQAKLHKGDSGSWAVEQICDYDKNVNTDDGYSRIPWVISTCNKFDDKAKDIATENRVHLINGEEFARMLLDAGLKTFKIEV